MPSGLTRGWLPVFPRDKREAFARRSCSNKKIGRDDDSKKSHRAPGCTIVLRQSRTDCSTAGPRSARLGAWLVARIEPPLVMGHNLSQTTPRPPSNGCCRPGRAALPRPSASGCVPISPRPSGANLTLATLGRTSRCSVPMPRRPLGQAPRCRSSVELRMCLPGGLDIPYRGRCFHHCESG